MSLGCILMKKILRLKRSFGHFITSYLLREVGHVINLNRTVAWFVLALGQVTKIKYKGGNGN